LSSSKLNILLIEDDSGIADLIQESLSDNGFTADWVNNFIDADKHLDSSKPDLLIIDYGVKDITASDWLRDRKNSGKETPPFLVSTGQGDEKIAVDMMKLGAKDYIVKDSFFLERLPEIVKRVCLLVETEEKIKSADIALKESQERFRTIFESAAEAIFIAEIETGIIVDANHAASELINMPLNEIIGMHQSKLHPTDSIDTFRMHLLSNGSSKYLEAIENSIIRTDGVEIPVEIVASKVDLGGKACLLGIFRDIRERKIAELLRETNVEIQSILTSTGDIKEEITKIGRLIKDRLKLDSVGIRLQEGDDYPYYWADGFPKDFIALENSLVLRNRQGGLCRDANGKVSLECTCGLIISGKTDPTNPLFTKGGSSWTNDSFPFLDLPLEQDPRTRPRNNCIHYGYASIALIPIRAKNSIIGLIQLNDKRKDVFKLSTIELMEAIAANIGEGVLRKKAEAELINYKDHLEETIKHRTNELDEANKLLKDSLEKEKELNELKSRFISTASHEFRTPLTAILSSVEMIKKYGINWSEEKKTVHMDRIINSVNYLTHLISDILDVNRNDSGKLEFNPQPVSLIDISNSIIEEIKLHADERHKFEFHYLTEMNKFNLDPKHIQTILRNLISNAYKYSPDGGTIRLEISSGEEYVQLTINDQGIGIPQNEVAKLFEPFYRATNIEEIRGNGLGLTIVKNAVDIHNGTITVDSEIGKGTTFKVRLPIK